MARMEINDRVQIISDQECVKSDGTFINIPSGHEGVVIETRSMAASAQSRWGYIVVELAPINGVSYTLKTESMWFRKLTPSPAGAPPPGSSE